MHLRENWRNIFFSLPRCNVEFYAMIVKTFTVIISTARNNVKVKTHFWSKNGQKREDRMTRKNEKYSASVDDFILLTK